MYLCIILDKVNGFLRDYNGTKYLVLFGPEKYDVMFYRIRYLIELNRDITTLILLIMQKSKIDSDDNLPLEKN